MHKAKEQLRKELVISSTVLHKNKHTGSRTTWVEFIPKLSLLRMPSVSTEMSTTIDDVRNMLRKWDKVGLQCYVHVIRPPTNSYMEVYTVSICIHPIPLRVTSSWYVSVQ